MLSRLCPFIRWLFHVSRFPKDAHDSESVSSRANVRDKADEIKTLVAENRETLVQPNKKATRLKHKSALVDNSRTVNQRNLVVVFGFLLGVRRVCIDYVGFEREKRREFFRVADDVGGCAFAGGVDAHSSVFRRRWQRA